MILDLDKHIEDILFCTISRSLQPNSQVLNLLTCKVGLLIGIAPLREIFSTIYI